MSAAAAASSGSPFLLPASCIKRLADMVDRRSSRNSTGTAVRRPSSRAKSLTFSACLPTLPSMDTGRPTMMLPTLLCWTTLMIAAMSASSSLRSIITRGLASIPPGSLSASPILRSPTSRPRTRVIRLLPISLPAPGPWPVAVPRPASP